MEESKQMGLDYKSSGVDIEAGYRSVELMKEHVRRTMRPEVLGGLGGFSGAFSLKDIKNMENPVLLSTVLFQICRVSSRQTLSEITAAVCACMHGKPGLLDKIKIRRK